MRAFCLRVLDQFNNLMLRQDFLTLTLCLFPLLLLCIPPNGVLTMNEEVYLTMADKTFMPEHYGPQASFMESTQTRFLFNWPVGWMVYVLGGNATQMICRFLLAAGYAWTVAMLARRLRLTVLDVVVAVIGFYLLEQNILGEDWVFISFESKAVAYALLFAALALVFDGKPVPAAVLCALGTYMHFQAAGYWWLFICVWQYFFEKNKRSIALAMGVYLLCCLPQAMLILHEYGGTFGIEVKASNGWTADYIYSVWRIPHHMAPFASLGRFSLWAPGIGLLLGLLCCVAWIWRTSEKTERALAGLILVALIWMTVLLLAMLFDRQFILGKLYPFRPGSVALFLILLLCCMMLQQRFCHRAAVLKFMLLTILFPVFFAKTVDAALEPIKEEYSMHADRQEVMTWVCSNLNPSDILLVSEEMEVQFMRLERECNIQLWANFRAIPTQPKSIVEWYERTHVRDSLYETRCKNKSAHPATYMLVASKNMDQYVSDCGDVVFRGKKFAVIHFSAF